LLQNPRINDQARRQANPLILLNLVSDQALREIGFVEHTLWPIIHHPPNCL
jgi:hypothetical protein